LTVVINAGRYRALEQRERVRVLLPHDECAMAQIGAHSAARQMHAARSVDAVASRTRRTHGRVGRCNLFPIAIDAGLEDRLPVVCGDGACTMSARGHGASGK
jgi:hypothetical protein